MYTSLAAVIAHLEELLVLEGMSVELHSLYVDKATLDSLYADKTALDSIYLDKPTLDSLFSDKMVLDSLHSDKLTLDSLYLDKAKLDSLFTDKVKLDSLYSDRIILNSLYSDKMILDGLYESKTAIDSLFADKLVLYSLVSDKVTLDSLYADKATLDSLFANKVSLDRIYLSIDNIDTTINNLSNIDTVAGDIVTVAAVGNYITSVNTVANSIDSVRTVATNISDVTNFADVYYGPLVSDPTTRNDLSLMLNGDFYFNTTSKQLLFYDGAVWKLHPVQEHNLLTGLNVGDFNHLTAAEVSKLTSIEASATADQTDTEIKTAYENNPDTNVYTDSEKLSLSHINGAVTVNETTPVVDFLNTPTVPLGNPTLANEVVNKQYVDTVKSVVVTGTSTLNSIDDMFLVDATAGSIVLTLPNIEGRLIRVYRDDNSANTVTFTDTISGSTTFSLLQHEVLNIVKIGTLWRKI